jgi:hypothetical protein
MEQPGMRGICMPTFQRLLLCLAALVLTGLAFGQEPSLGDVARQQRKKQASKPANASAKVVTNEDIPEHPDAGEDSARVSDVDKPEPSPESNFSGSSESKPAQSAGQWKARILAQKTLVAAQQEQVEHLRGSIHFVEANRYVNGVQYNEQQRRRQIQLGQMENQLQEQKKKLTDMQEAARRAGFGNAVYDPTD